MSPLPRNVAATSHACEGNLSPNHAAPAIQLSPPAISKRIIVRRCFRNPAINAMEPNSATSKARLRCTLSSAGRKCAKTAEKEISTGVSKQWTTHNAEVQTPSLSAHWRDPAAETDEGSGISSDYCEPDRICNLASDAVRPSGHNLAHPGQLLP